MPATLNKINVHAMLKWVIQLIERELNALGEMWSIRSTSCNLIGEICNIFNIVKGVAPVRLHVNVSIQGRVMAGPLLL